MRAIPLCATVDYLLPRRAVVLPVLQHGTAHLSDPSRRVVVPRGPAERSAARLPGQLEQQRALASVRRRLGTVTRQTTVLSTRQRSTHGR